MAIFTTLTNTLTGQVSASERKLYITLHGFNGHALVDEIYKIWRTSRIENQVFNDIGRFSVTFHKFFLLDIIYTLETIVKQPYTSLSRRSILKAIDALKNLTDLRIVFDGTQVNSIVDKSAYRLFKKTPQTWQDEYLDIYSDRIQRYKLTGHLLDAKPGTGKTLGSLFLMEALKCDTIIVVAPKAVIIDAWKNTIEEEYKQVPHYWHSIMPTSPTLNNHLYVLHYEYLPKFMDFINSQNRASFGKVGLVLDECLAADTELLTPVGFKKIIDITTDDLILQYHPDGTNSWVNPSRVVKKPTLEVHHYQHDEWEQVVTPNHRMIFFDDTTKKIKESLSRNCDLSNASYKTIVRKDEVDVLIDNKTTTKTIEHLDKPVDFYCVTVPTGMFYIRYNGKISVTGNCHNFNEENSNRTQALIELTRKNVNYSLWMSGTPIKKLGKEIIPLESCIDPLFDEDCRKRFIGVFGRSSDRALDILANRIGIISHTVQSTNVITDIKLNTYTANVTLQNGQEYTIPSIREKMKKYIEERSKFYKANMDSFIQDFRDAIQYYQETIRHKPQEKEALNTYLQYIEEIRRGYDPVAMKEQAMYCNRFEKTKIIPILPKELKDPFRKAKSVYKYVQLTIMGECLGVILGKSRIDCNIDLALNLGNMKLIPEGNASPLGEMSLADVINNATKKTIIFSSFVEVVTNLKTQLIQQGFNPLVVYGDTNKDLPRIIDTFDRDDTSNPLIATFQSLSTGVRLTMANTIIMLNSPYRDHEYKQAVARAFRKGQDTDVNVINVLLDTGGVPNISTRSKDIADEAANIVALIMGVKKVDLDTLSNESFLEEQLDMVYRLSDQDRVALENCATCSNAGALPYSTSQGSIPVNSNHGTGVETVTKNNKGFDPESNLQQANTRDISGEREVPYYKTDKGNTIEEVMKLTEDDPMWDHIDKGNVLLKDKPKEDEGLTSFMTGVNQSYGW
nr:MAG TPA: Chromatin remodeling complex ATPase [Caudoviricetes sp.]